MQGAMALVEISNRLFCYYYYIFHLPSSLVCRMKKLYCINVYVQIKIRIGFDKVASKMHRIIENGVEKKVSFDTWQTHTNIHYEDDHNTAGGSNKDGSNSGNKICYAG